MEIRLLLFPFIYGMLAAEVDKVEDEDPIDSENIDPSPNLNPYAENTPQEAKNDDDQDLDAKPKTADQYLCLDEKLTATNKVSGDLAKDQTDFENLDLVGNQNPENEVYAEKAENEDEAAKYLSLDKKLKATDEYQPKAADDEKLTTKKKAAKDLCLDDKQKPENKVPPKVSVPFPDHILQDIYGRLDIRDRVNIRATSRCAKAVIENNKWGMGYHFPPVMRSSKVVVSSKSWHLLGHRLIPMKSFQICQVHEFRLVSENKYHPQLRVPPLQLKRPVSNWNASIEFSGDLPSAVILGPWRQPIYRAVAGQAEVQVVHRYMVVHYRWTVPIRWLKRLRRDVEQRLMRDVEREI